MDPSSEVVLIYDGMMKTHHPNLTISESDVLIVGQITQPCKSISLAGAAILIVLSDHHEIPQNISWEYFRAFATAASSPSLAQQMNCVKPANIPQVE
jgi:hypothetical protein